MKTYLYIATWGVVLMVICGICRVIYDRGYDAGASSIPEIRIDETKAYDLGWKEGQSIQNFLPVPTKWLRGTSDWRIAPEELDELQVIGILTTSPRGPKDCIVWSCLEEAGRPHVLKHYSYAVDEMPSGKERYYYIGVWDCPNPLEKIDSED